jgi:hypothetical protein
MVHLSAFTFVVFLVLPGQEGQEKLPAERIVQMRAACFYKGPARRSGVLRKALYGEQVTVTAVKGRYAEVTLPKEGKAWIFASALIDKDKFVPAPVNEEEKMRLRAQSYEAGRFDPETEKSHRQKKGPATDAAYKQVDLLESRPAYKKDRAELERRLLEFRKAGKLGEFSTVQ